MRADKTYEEVNLDSRRLLVSEVAQRDPLQKHFKLRLLLLGAQATAKETKRSARCCLVPLFCSAPAELLVNIFEVAPGNVQA